MFGDELRAFGGGMNAVGLDGAGDLIDAVVEHGHEGQMMFGRSVVKDGVETLYVVGAVVGRQGYAYEQDADVGCLERG